MRNQQSFAPVASLLSQKDTQKIAKYLLDSYRNVDSSQFINLVNLLFLESVVSKTTRSPLTKCLLKSRVGTKMIHYVLKKVKRDQLLLHEYNIISVNDIVHMQKETVLSIFLQCRTNDEIKLLSKILRGKPLIPPELAIDALAEMCRLQYLYMVQNFCFKPCQSDFSKLLRNVFDAYPNYHHVAELLRVFDCDLQKLLEKGIRITLGFPVRTYSYHKDLFKKFQIHYSCEKNTVKLFCPTTQRLLRSYDRISRDNIKNFIRISDECIIDVEEEEEKDKEGKKRFIIYPLDVLLCDGIVVYHKDASTRRDILKKIIIETTISIGEGRDKQLLLFRLP